MSAPGLQAGDRPPPPFQNSGDTSTEGDAQGGYEPREGRLGAFTSAVPQGLALQPVLPSAPGMARGQDSEHPNGFAANAGLGGAADTPGSCVAVQRNLETLEKRADKDFTKLNTGCKAPFLGRNNLRALTGWKAAWQEKTLGSCRDAEHEPAKKVLGYAGKAEGRDPSPRPVQTKLQLEGRAQCWTTPYRADLAQDWSKPKEEPKG